MVQARPAPRRFSPPPKLRKKFYTAAVRVPHRRQTASARWILRHFPSCRSASSAATAENPPPRPGLTLPVFDVQEVSLARETHTSAHMSLSRVSDTRR
jgi:hypothetical protein